MRSERILRIFSQSLLGGQLLSRQFMGGFGVVFGVILLSSCSKNALHENSIGVRTPLRLESPAETQCLKDFDQGIASYLQGRESVQKIETLFGCSDRALALFTKRTQTAKPGVYSPAELRAFLKKFFLQNRTISDNLMWETMLVKEAILGGSHEWVTRQEISDVRKFLLVIRDELIRLAPYLPIPATSVSGEARQPSDDEWKRIGAAARALEAAGERIGSELARMGRKYEFVRFEALLQELAKLSEQNPVSDGGRPWARVILEHMDLLRAVKPVLWNSAGNAIQPGEWSGIFKTAARSYELSARFAFLNRHHLNGLHCGVGRERFQKTAWDLLEIVRDAVRARSSRFTSRTGVSEVPFTEIESLIMTFPQDELAPIRRGSLRSLIKPLFQRAFGGREPGPTGRGANGVTLPALDRIQEALDRWVAGQEYLEAVFKQLGDSPCRIRPQALALNSGGYHSSDSVFRVMDRPIEEVMGLPSSQISSRLRESATTIRSLLEKTPPLYEGSGIFIRIQSLPEWGHSFHDVSMVNTLHIFFYLGLEGYQEEPKDLIGPRRLGLKVSEIEAVYRDVRDLGVDLQIIDPTQSDAPRLRFRDAQLFLYASDGNDLLSGPEMVQLLALLMSAKTRAGEVHAGLGKQLPIHPSLTGLFGTPLIEREPFFVEFEKNFATNFSYLPDLVSYYQTLSTERRALFMQSVRELIGEGAQEPKKTPNENPRYRGYVAVTDLEKIYTVFHYMEILFAVYDEDRSGSINSPEAEKAFPRFHNIIGSLASGRSFTEDELAAVFSYLLAHGKRPSTIGEGLSFYWWKQSGWSSWRFETDRSTLLKMFSSITD